MVCVSSENGAHRSVEPRHLRDFLPSVPAQRLAAARAGLEVQQLVARQILQALQLQRRAESGHEDVVEQLVRDEPRPLALAVADGDVGAVAVERHGLVRHMNMQIERRMLGAKQLLQPDKRTLWHTGIIQAHEIHAI